MGLDVILYNNNLKALKKRYPNYASLVDRSRNSDLKLRSTNSKFKDILIESKNIRLYGNDVINTCNCNIGIHNVNYCKMGIFLGFGYEILFYMEQVSLKLNTDRIIIIEHDPAKIKLLMGLIELHQVFEHPNVDLIIPTNDNLFISLTDKLISNSTFYMLRNFNFFYNLEYFNIYKDFYINAMAEFKKAATHVLMYYGNDAKDSFIGIENMFNNIPEIINNPGINILKDKFKNIPAVCIASGPSLDKNMDLLKGLENKAVLIAADASLKPLLAKGIKPHMITSLEREIEIVDLFKDITDDYSDVYFAGCPVVYKEVYDTFKGPRLIVYRKFDHFKWLEIDRGMLEIKVSPGNMNFKIAEYLGCDPIILIGQDLALDGDKTNVSNTPFGESQASYLAEPQFKVKGNFCPEITTTRSLNMMLESFIIDVEQFKGITINATEGGAYIHGTEIMKFKEAIDLFIIENHNVNENIKKYLSEFKVDENDMQKIKENIYNAIKTFTEIVGKCKEAYNWLKTPRKDDANLDGTLEKINQYKMDIQKDEKVWQLLMAHFAQSVFINHELWLSTFREENTIEEAKLKYIKESDKIFEIFSGLSEIYLKLLKKKGKEFYEK